MYTVDVAIEIEICLPVIPRWQLGKGWFGIMELQLRAEVDVQ